MSSTESDGQTGLTNHQERQPPQPPVDEPAPPDTSGIELGDSGDPEELETESSDTGAPSVDHSVSRDANGESSDPAILETLPDGC